jgi:hypothetical protein
MMDPDKQNRLVAALLSCPLNEAAAFVRMSSCANSIGAVASMITGIDPHPEQAEMWARMAVRSMGFALLELGLPPGDIFIAERSEDERRHWL